MEVRLALRDYVGRRAAGLHRESEALDKEMREFYGAEPRPPS